MRYDAPDRLEKRTLAPRAEKLVLAGGILTVDRGKTHVSWICMPTPRVQPFIESVRATLAGDRGALEQLFTLEFDGSLARWSHDAGSQGPPRSSARSRRCGSTASQDQLLNVEIRQADGDRSLMTLRPAAVP